MTNKSISALTAATTPLSGTELVPVVQGGATTKVTVANLTAGRDFSALGLTLTGLTASYGVITDGAKKLASVALTGSGSLVRDTSPTISGNWTANTNYSFGGLNYSLKIQYSTASGGYIGQSIASGGLSMMQGGYYRGGGPHITDANSTSFAAVSVVNGDTIIYGNTGLTASTTFTATPRISIAGATGDVSLSTGNLVQGTAAKGINFTANTPAAGMTSRLLNWYEEGIWTPNQGAGLTVVGAFSSNGTYVRIGRSITVKGQVLGATTVAVTAAGVISSNLPFTAASGHAGSMYNAAIAVGGVIAITSTSATAASAITATPSITFTATYQV